MAINEDFSPIQVSHVADFYHRYPGETVTFYTLVEIMEAVPGFILRIRLPETTAAHNYRPPANHDLPVVPDLEIGSRADYLVWRVEQKLPAGTRYEYQTLVTVGPITADTTLESQATIHLDSGGPVATETVCVTVDAKGRYLEHLPALYNNDEMMGRFVMLFESFWKPIERQIEDMWVYMDARLTTSEFLPWLAGWIGLALDENWPEYKRRRLLLAAARLYRMRGTARGLIEYLEIYTDREAEIHEQRAENFRLGPEAYLGPNIALGRGNRPHTFTVSLQLPPVEAEDEEERGLQEALRRRTIESIIESEKPAHTSYTLQLEIEPKS